MSDGSPSGPTLTQHTRGTWRTALGQWVENWELFDWQQQIRYRSPRHLQTQQFLLVRPWLRTQQFRCQRILSLDPFLAALAAGKASRTNPTRKRTFCQTKNVGTYTSLSHGMLWRVCGKSSIFIYVPFQSPCFSTGKSAACDDLHETSFFWGGGNLPKLMEVWGPWP